MIKLIDSLKNIVPDEKKDAALRFKAYFEKQFLGNHVLSWKNFNHFRSILAGFYDTTNNVSETVNHKINSKIPRGHQNINQISGYIHEVKVESLGQLVANMQDETNMSLHNPAYLRRRELVTNQVRRFAELDKPIQKTRLIR